MDDFTTNGILQGLELAVVPERAVDLSLVFQRLKFAAELLAQAAPCSKPALLYRFDDCVRSVEFDDELSVGRAEENTLAIPSAFLSRAHFKISLRDRGARLHDSGSSNGVLVNGTRCGEAELASGDVITAGSIHFVFIHVGNTPPE